MREFTVKIKVRAPVALLEAHKKKSCNEVAALVGELPEELSERLNINGMLSSVIDAIGTLSEHDEECWLYPGNSFKKQTHTTQNGDIIVEVSTTEEK